MRSVPRLLCISLTCIAAFTASAAENNWSGYDVQPLHIEGEQLGDNDGDGVIDARDDCDNVNADAVISNAGCAENRDVISRTELEIEFDSDDWHVKKPYLDELQRFAESYQTRPGAWVVIEGHTDSTGDAGHNLKLSQLRAREVARRLVQDYGLDKSRIRWVGYGESRPVADNKTREGRQKNRRIVAVMSAHELKEIRSWSVE